jgi:hypothetical protein
MICYYKVREQLVDKLFSLLNNKNVDKQDSLHFILLIILFSAYYIVLSKVENERDILYDILC